MFNLHISNTIFVKESLTQRISEFGGLAIMIMDRVCFRVRVRVGVGLGLESCLG